MFEDGELRDLICEAAKNMGFLIGPPPKDVEKSQGRTDVTYGLEIVEDSWERSNFYVELRLWTSP